MSCGCHREDLGRLCWLGRGIGIAAAAMIWIAPGDASGQVLTRASVNSAGMEGDADSLGAAVSPDGIYIAFASDATNLGLNDTNQLQDVFVHNRQNGSTALISVDQNGQEGIFLSSNPSISQLGAFVAFESPAYTLVPNDNNAVTDVFVRELGAGITARVSVNSFGIEGSANSFNPSISYDGRYVAFDSPSVNLDERADTNGFQDVFVHDRTAARTERVSFQDGGFVEGNGLSGSCALSGDGRFVAFVSRASNLVIGDFNGRQDVFVRDRLTLVTIRVSVSSLGVEADAEGFLPSISADGRFIAYYSVATNLVADDTNNQADVFVHDLLTSQTTRVSVSSTGVQGNAFSGRPAISGDGRFVAFQSSASNLVPGDTNGQPDIFVRDLVLGTTIRVDVDAACTESNNGSFFPAISADGRAVAFQSTATNLVGADTNGAADIFVSDRTRLAVDQVLPATGSEAGGDLANVFGLGFTTIQDTMVTIGGVAATVVAVSPTGAQVRTPAGTGTAAIVVSNPAGCAIASAPYQYVSPAIAARFGNVNVGSGDRENVLTVNSSFGDASREIFVNRGEFLSMDMANPSSLPVARWVLYAWLGIPVAGNLSPHPQGLGSTVFPTPVTGGSPPPVKIWNNFGFRPILGTPNFPSSPAPSNVFRRPGGAPIQITATFQGFIQDSGSQIPQSVSITNALILHIQ